jgi:predicted membrane chloride channel (bestrophin family)
VSIEAQPETQQADAATAAATARQAIARKIVTLVPKVKTDAEAQVVLHLAEAYAHLAAEPPRVRAG